ncbi:MAG: c-type cytochrome [Gemmatimonadales bacterium]
MRAPVVLGFLLLATGPLSAQKIGPTPGPAGASTATANPYTGNRTAIGEGRRLFLWYNCAGCHGDHAGGGMGPSLRDSSWIYGGLDAQIFASISQGRTKGMPAWGSQLPAGEIWKLVAYIKTLRTSAEPDRPDH